MPRPAPAEAIFMKVSCLVLLLTASPEPRAVLNNNTFTLLPSPMEGAPPPPMGDRTMVGYELRKAGGQKNARPGGRSPSNGVRQTGAPRVQSIFSICGPNCEEAQQHQLTVNWPNN